MVKRLTYFLLTGLTCYLFILGCQNKISNASDTDPFFNQNKLPVEVPSDVEADYFKISIITADGDSVVYFEKVQSNAIQIAVPSEESSKIVLNAYKGNVLVYSGFGIVNAGQQTSVILIKQTTTSTTLPSTPASPKVDFVNGNITITWQPTDGTVMYKVYRSYESNENSVLIDSSQTTKYVDVAVAGKKVFYRISASNAAGESALSDASSITVPDDTITVDPQPPAVPQNVAATANGTSSIVITWDKVSGAESYYVYRINQTTLVSQKIGTTSTHSYSDANITSGSTWGYSVSAINSAGESAMSTTVVATTGIAKPSAPQNVTATAISEKSISVTWGKVVTATSYKVEWAQQKSGPFTSVSATENEYTISNLTASTLYYCRVSSINSAGQSDPSELVNATTKDPAVQPPAAPELTAKSISDTSIQISWSQVTSAVVYIIEQGKTSTGDFAPVCTTSALTWIVKKLEAGTTYYFRAKTTNTAGVSPYSATVSAITATALNSPAGLAKDTATAKTISLKWQAADGATSYKIYRSTSASGQYAAIGTATTTTFTDTGLNEATTYYYKVSSVKDAFESAKSNSVSASTSASGPATPTGLTATAASSSSITIKFTAVTGATGYKLYWSTNNTTFTAISLTSTKYTHSGLTANTTYYYKVSAVQQGTESVQSTVVSTKTSAASTKVAVINAAKCVGCNKCVPRCKTGAIKRSGMKYVIDAALCDGDGACISACRHGAITLQ